MKNLLAPIMAAATLFTASTAFAFSTQGFSNPYGVVVDPKTNYIYVSNVNGAPDARDDNAFISRLKGDGTVDQLRFIDGVNPKITLHAPKGMAILGTTLYVADIDKLHAFDLTSGQPLFDVNFGTLPVQHFYDVKAAPDGALYLADGPGNTVYKVDVPKQHEVTTLTTGDLLGQPHGIAWFPVRSCFVVAGWSSGQVTAYDRGGKRQPYPAIFLRTIEGIEADDSGSFFVTSAGLNAVYRVAPNFALSALKLGFPSPAGLAFHRAGNQVIVASSEGNIVESIPIPAPGAEPPAGNDLLPTPPVIEGKPPDAGATATTPAAQALAPKPEEKKAEEKKPEEKKPEATTPKPAAAEKPAATGTQTPPPAPAPAPSATPKPPTPPTPPPPRSQQHLLRAPQRPNNKGHLRVPFLFSLPSRPTGQNPPWRISVLHSRFSRHALFSTEGSRRDQISLPSPQRKTLCSGSFAVSLSQRGLRTRSRRKRG